VDINQGRSLLCIDKKNAPMKVVRSKNVGRFSGELLFPNVINSVLNLFSNQRVVVGRK
jgi:hypothetical protein